LPYGEILASREMGQGWKVKLVTQPSRSADSIITGLVFVVCLKSRVWEVNASSIDEVAET
ncbi:unnamed protein product, partial [Sphacelaria rigidula]